MLLGLGMEQIMVKALWCRHILSLQSILWHLLWVTGMTTPARFSHQRIQGFRRKLSLKNMSWKNLIIKQPPDSVDR